MRQHETTSTMGKETTSMMENDENTRWSGLETEGMKAAGSSLLYNQEIFGPAFTKYFELLPSVQSVPMVVAGRCTLLPENYQDFETLYQQQSPDHTSLWPDVKAFMLCPICGKSHTLPQTGDQLAHEYWMIWYPVFSLIDETVRMRILARLMCLSCMEVILEDSAIVSNQGSLQLLLPSAQTLIEAGNVTLHGESIGNNDDIVSAWNLYKYWDMHHFAELTEYFKVPHKIPELDFAESKSCQTCARHDALEGCKITFKCYKCGVYFCSECDRSHACMVVPKIRKTYECENCGKQSEILKKCACNKIIYCSVDCQRQHYKVHKFQCNKKLIS